MATGWWGDNSPNYEWTTGATDNASSPRLNPWYGATLGDYATEGKTGESIGVDKGKPDNARYAIFYAVDKDPVIFCKTYSEMKKEVAKLRKRKDVIQKSIRVFKLIGGIKKK